MPATFAGKIFNPEVFGRYLETIPRVKQDAFISSGIFRNRADLRTMLSAQTGGNYITIPMIGRIGGDADNYDGTTDMTVSTLDSYAQSMIVVGRMHTWTEKDFTTEITGHDFMGDIAAQLASYQDDVDNTTVLKILEGIFGVNTDGFSERHTLDMTGTTTGTVTETSLLEAAQKAGGDNRGLFNMVIMHSAIATALEKMEVLEYRKYTDAQGIQRQISLADWNGKTVLIDDDVPVERSETTAGVYTMQITTKATAGDIIKINNVELIAGTDFDLTTDTATGNAAAIATALNASNDATVAKYTWSSTSTKLVATEKIGYYGTGKFNATATKGGSGTLAIGSVTTDTAPVVGLIYTTYILGREAFDYCDCGAKVPYSTSRDEMTAGGVDKLHFRQRKLFAPHGFSFIMPSPAIISPNDTQLATAANWDIVKNMTGGAYYNSKAIPFARILSRG